MSEIHNALEVTVQRITRYGATRIGPCADEKKPSRPIEIFQGLDDHRNEYRCPGFEDQIANENVQNALEHLKTEEDRQQGFERS